MLSSPANEFRFLMRNNKTSWEKGLLHSLTASDEGIKLKETFDYTLSQIIYADQLQPAPDIKDFAVGQCNLLYILDANTHSLYQCNLEQTKDCIESSLPDLTIITLTAGSLLVAYDEAEQKVLGLDSNGWQVKWAIGASQDAAGKKLALKQPIKPVDLAIDKAGKLYVLDLNNLAILHFDESGRFLAAFGQEVLRGKNPVAIALSPDDSLYVLERQEKKVLKFVAGQLELQFDIHAEIKPSGLAIDQLGHLYVGDDRIIDAYDEDDRFIHIFSLSGKGLGELSGYRGSVKKIVIDRENRLYVLNEEQQKIFIFKREPFFSRKKATSLPSGIFFTQAFDSAKPGTQWHKFVLDADLPEQAQIKVSYLVADEKTFLLNGEEQDLDLFLGSRSMLPEEKMETVNKLKWSEPLPNPLDALVRGNPGRFLWLRVELIGSERITPTVKSVRAVFPRISYLRYLPAIYQEDEVSRDFLERFLSLFETFFANLESEINHIVRFFDADAVSGDFLRWLASWLSIAVDDNWPEEKLRQLVKRVPELYKMRGTRQGIEEMIELFIEKKPFIVEQVQLEWIKDQKLKKTFEKLYGKNPYCFFVLLPQLPIKDKKQLMMVRRILDLEIPAHTHAELVELQPWIHLGMHTYIGVNTYLSKPDLRLDSGTIMPRDTILA